MMGPRINIETSSIESVRNFAESGDIVQWPETRSMFLG
jgi:hypothetical protein